jgi:hypothetical protein
LCGIQLFVVLFMAFLAYSKRLRQGLSSTAASAHTE